MRLIELACGEDAAGPLVAPAEAVERAIAARPMLGADQAAAVRALGGGRGRVRVLEARAGSGKSFALAAVREAYASVGVPVLGTAWQGRAAEVLGREAGLESQTTALLLERLARGEEPIPQGAVVVVDEAGSMPTHAMERLVSAVSECGGRVILAGDSRQLPAIAAGGALAGLAERIGAAELTGNRRQADALQREVAHRLADGEEAGAVERLAEQGRLQGYRDGREARAALIAHWREDCIGQPERGLILAHDRREVAGLNALARAEREAAGLLGPERLVAAGREWAVGDRLTCRRNDYRLDVRNGTRGSVVALDLGGDVVRSAPAPSGASRLAVASDLVWVASAELRPPRATLRGYDESSARLVSGPWPLSCGARRRPAFSVDLLAGPDSALAAMEDDRGLPSAFSRGLAITPRPAQAGRRDRKRAKAMSSAISIGLVDRSVCASR